MKPISNFSLFFVLFLSVTELKAQEILIKQPDTFYGVRQLLPFVFESSHSSPTSGTTLFIGAEKQVSGPQSLTLAEKLDRSRIRPYMLVSYTEIMNEFWHVFASRVAQLRVSAAGASYVYDYEGMSLYDHQRGNPVRDFLSDRMGLSESESYHLYKQLQKSYSQGGIASAKNEYLRFFSEQWQSALYLIFDFETLARIKHVEAELNFRSTSPETQETHLKKMAERIAAYFFNPSLPGGSDLDSTLNRIITSWVYQNKDRLQSLNQVEVSSLILSELQSIFADSSSISSILQTEDDRIRHGIEYEAVKDLGHAYGPKSKLTRINESIFVILRAQLYLGISFEKAVGFINFVLKNRDVYTNIYTSTRPSESSEIKDKSHRIFSGMKNDFEKEVSKGQTIQCLSIFSR